MPETSSSSPSDDGWWSRCWLSATSEYTLAAVTKAIIDSASRRRRGCSNSSTLGVAKNIPTSSVASSAGISQKGPTVRRSGSANCSPIAASTLSWAGQKGSLAPGGG